LKEIEQNFYFPSVYQTIVVLRINRYARSSSQFQKGWWPLSWKLVRKVSFVPISFTS